MTAISYTLPHNLSQGNPLAYWSCHLSSVSSVGSVAAGQVARMLSDKIEDDVRVTTFRAKEGTVSTVLNVLERLLSPLVAGVGAQLDIRA
jgi:hypothetical protein